MLNDCSVKDDCDIYIYIYKYYIEPVATGHVALGT